MTGLESVLAAAGGWSGSSVLQDPMNGLSETSQTTMEVTPVLGRTFVRLDYSWDYKGTPHAGTMLVGHAPKNNVATIAWADSWHMGRSIMLSTGSIDDEGIVDVLGQYAAPPGPDWGWRTVIVPSADSLRVTMFNISPEGVEELAVQATYRRLS